LRSVLAFDVFCGPLDIFEQQRFGFKSVALSSQETTDLKHCLELCCSVLSESFSSFFS
uniref:16S rRNA (uracil(1498)-N(3))-methyltransferase n=1 Tax=Angiostrongylus costaricensis TaxID=334426 RepID=A0A0R3PC27_ANGCS